MISKLEVLIIFIISSSITFIPRNSYIKQISLQSLSLSVPNLLKHINLNLLQILPYIKDKRYRYIDIQINEIKSLLRHGKNLKTITHIHNFYCHQRFKRRLIPTLTMRKGSKKVIQITKNYFQLQKK